MGGRILRLRLLESIATVDCDLRGAFADLSDLFCLFVIAEEPSAPVDAAFSLKSSDRGGGLVLARDDEQVLETSSYAYLLACLENEIIGHAISTAREHLVLHAMATARDGKGIVFPGEKRVGKTTLGAFLTSNGFDYFADDVAAIDLETLELVPLPLPLHVKGETEELIRSCCPGLEVRPYGSLPSTYPARCALPPGERLPERACSVDLVIFPCYGADKTTDAVELSKAEAALEIIGHSLNFEKLGARAFSAVAALARRARCYGLEYDDLAAARATIDDLLESFEASPASRR